MAYLSKLIKIIIMEALTRNIKVQVEVRPKDTWKEELDKLLFEEHEYFVRPRQILENSYEFPMKKFKCWSWLADYCMPMADIADTIEDVMLEYFGFLKEADTLSVVNKGKKTYLRVHVKDRRFFFKMLDHYSGWGSIKNCLHDTLLYRDFLKSSGLAFLYKLQGFFTLDFVKSLKESDIYIRGYEPVKKTQLSQLTEETYL